MMFKSTDHYSQSHVAFEASVLAQQQFESIAIPYAGSAKLDWYLKLWNKRILDNDICQWAWWTARARVENNNHQLAESDLETILKDVDQQSAELRNPALLRWFNQADASWLDNLRANIERMHHDTLKALALMAGMLVGDYILAFAPEAEDLRQPLAQVYFDLLKLVNRIIDNQGFNRAANLEAVDFITRTKADLLYLKLPAPGSMVEFLNGPRCWREVWVRGHGDVFGEIFPVIKETLGGMVLSKERYQQLLAEQLDRCKHLPGWAISFQANQPLSLTEMAEAIKKHRPVQATYAKDLSDLGGGQCYIMITAKA